jgi:hypothetical protein
MKQSYVTVNVSLMKTTVAVGDNSNSSQIQNTLGILVVPILSVRSHWIEDVSHPMSTNILHQILSLYFSPLVAGTNKYYEYNQYLGSVIVMRMFMTS